MGAVPYQPPVVFMAATADAPSILSLPPANGQTFAEGDIAIVTSGQLVKAASNTSTNIAGIMMQASGTDYYAGTGGSAAAKSPQSFFGASTGPGALFQGDDQLNLMFSVLGTGQYAEMSLVQTLTQASLGASVGLTLDSGSGYFVADTTATACAVIYKIISSVPGYQSSGSGNIGDTGARVVVRFLTSALAF